jgi:signal transduction histidine kinase
MVGAGRAGTHAIAGPDAVPRARVLRWPKQGLRTRATLAVALTSLVLSTTLAVLAYSLVRRALVEDRESSLVRSAYVNARVVRGALRTADPEMAELLAGLRAGAGRRSVLVTTTETFTSTVDVELDDLPGPVVAGVGDGSVAHQIVDTGDGPALVVGIPIEASDAAYYEVTSLDDVDRTLQVLASSLAVGGGVAVAVGAAVGAAVSGAVVRPLRRVADVARRIVDGQLDTRLDVDPDRDLAALAEAFNAMLDELRERIRRESRFASDVTHELRGPLTVLAAAVDVVERRRADLPPEAGRAVEALDAQVRSFNKLVVDLLEISRFEAGSARLDTRPVDLEELVTAVVAERPEPRPGVKVAEAAGARVDLDPRRMQQVLTNLLDNADHHAGGATAITIERHRPGRVRIGVDDDGPGVLPADRVRIFERFERGTAPRLDPESRRGSGLGLALAANHVQLHDGRIWVEDSPDGGARFVVELPGEPPG